MMSEFIMPVPTILLVCKNILFDMVRGAALCKIVFSILHVCSNYGRRYAPGCFGAKNNFSLILCDLYIKWISVKIGKCPLLVGTNSRFV